MTHRRELLATAVFAATAIAAGLVLALVPHVTRSAPLPYAPYQSRLDMNWAFSRVHVHAVGGARTYGLAKSFGRRGAHKTLQVRALVRPESATGGHVCLYLFAAGSTPAESVQAHSCRPLSAGWRKFDPVVQLTTRAPSQVYARIDVTGNAGGIEVRPVALTG